MTGLLDLLVIGSPYSGSTLLANALNGHRLIMNAGELSACFPEFELGVQEPFCPLCGAAGRPCPVWTPEFIEKVRVGSPQASRAAFRRAVGSPVVVDSSKFPEWLDFAWKTSGIVENVIVTISRNPFAYHVSNRRRTDAPADRSAEEWAHCYGRAFDWITEHKARHWHVRYEDLATEPAEALRGLMDFLSLPWDPGMLRFWEKPLHALNGNAGAYMWYPEFARNAQFERPEDAQVAHDYASRTFGGWADSKWHAALSAQEIELLLNGKAGLRLRQLCERIGYDVDRLARVALHSSLR